MELRDPAVKVMPATYGVGPIATATNEVISASISELGNVSESG